jgi:hypothetical protein
MARCSRTAKAGYLLAVDAGRNQVSVLKIGSGGGLSLVGSPASSGGAMPVSIAAHDGLVYVANASGAPNFMASRHFS